MNHIEMQQPKYGNWVSDKRISKTLLLFVGFAAAAALLLTLGARWGTATTVLAVLLLLLAVLMLASGLYFLRAKELFADEGGGVQRKVVDLVLDRVQWDGKGRALDIGCGSGALAIGLAKRYPQAAVDGIDYWGGSWSYIQKQCEENAALEGVPGRITFQKASASALPFADETFDLAVSNLIFHEVSDTKDKRNVVKEALRVVKNGGTFVFQDLFPLYIKPEGLVDLMKSLGVKEARYEDTSKSPFIPGALKLPFMVGTLGMVYGIK